MPLDLLPLFYEPELTGGHLHYGAGRMLRSLSENFDVASEAAQIKYAHVIASVSKIKSLYRKNKILKSDLNFDLFSYEAIASLWPEYRLSKDFVLTDKGSLSNVLTDMANKKSITRFFIRQNSCLKAFSGFVYNSGNEFPVNFKKVPDDVTLIVMPFESILAKKRVWVSLKQGIVTSSLFHGLEDFPVESFIQSLKASAKGPLPPLFVLDIALTSHKELKLIDMMPFATTALVGAEITEILYAMDERFYDLRKLLDKKYSPPA